MTKLRSWPAAIPAPSLEMKKQYEFDPAAGAGNSKIISIETTYANSAGSSTTKINYVNGAPVSGTGEWQSYVMAYHWFLYISSGYLTTKVVNYSDSGNWPSKSLKFLVSTVVDGKHNVMKMTSISECIQKNSFLASSAFPSLPGKVYEYRCTSSGSTSLTTKSNNDTTENGTEPTSSTMYYSDYLDMNLMYKLVGVQQWVTYKIEFIGGDNKPHLLSYRNDQISLP
jgi:hypothetical protein